MRRARPILLLVATLLAATGTTNLHAEAAVIAPNVFTDDNTTNGNCTLREAIRSANQDVAIDGCPAGSGPDTIRLQPGTYSLTNENGGEDAALTGDLDITADLVIEGAGPSRTVIRGAWPTDPDRIFHVPVSGIDVTMSGVTIRDGLVASSGGGLEVGGASTVLVRDAVFTNNQGNFGGGIQNAGTLTLQRVTVAGNRATTRGGAVYNNEVAFLTDVALTGNQILPGGFDGGAMYSHIGTMTNVVVAGNSAPVDAGGLELDTNNALTNVTVSGNSAGRNGGGIELDGTTHSLNNVTIFGNTADADGNGTGDGGGLYLHSTNAATVDNTIIAGNRDRGGQAPDCAVDPVEVLTSGGNNLVGNTSGCTFTPAPGDLLNVNPKLGPLADNGGFTQTHALLKGSPAIDAAGPDAAPTDQRGLPRNPDIGAYELVFCAKVPVNRIGTSGKDKLRGTNKADGMLGLGGNDTLVGKGGKDGLCGGPGKDKLKGGPGKDRARNCAKERMIP